MNPTLLKPLLLLLPTGILFVLSFATFRIEKTLLALVQFLGAGLLTIALLTHIFEAFPLFSFMRWGSPYSIGHYLDLSGEATCEK
jgi:hypothetical protein